MQTNAQRKEIVLAQMKAAEMYANYWMHSATNGHAATRKIYDGFGSMCNADELRNDAMETSLRHIQRFNDLIETLHEIHENEND